MKLHNKTLFLIKMNVDSLVVKYEKIMKELELEHSTIDPIVFYITQPIYQNDRGIYKKILKDLRKLQKRLEKEYGTNRNA